MTIERIKYMNLIKTEYDGLICAEVESDCKVITDAQSTVDLLMSAKYELGTKNLLIAKRLVAEDLFILSTGLAGEVLQKLINYGGRIAIYGDYSRYTSKPLKDFMFESNKGRDVFFTATRDEALDMLSKQA